MPILTHMTEVISVLPILSEGLRLPSETGNKNYFESSNDRICFAYWEEKFPMPKKANVDFWGGSTGFVLDNNYIKENSELFKYSGYESMAEKFAQELGIERNPYRKSTDYFREFISFQNIPVEALHSLLIHNQSPDAINQIGEHLPSHMQLYLKKNVFEYRRIK